MQMPSVITDGLYGDLANDPSIVRPDILCECSSYYQHLFSFQTHRVTKDLRVLMEQEVRMVLVV